MTNLKLLIIEDSDEERSICRDTIERYKVEKDRDIILDECKNLIEARERLKNDYDGAIVDIMLTPNGTEGLEVINDICDFNKRVPIIIRTGTPDPVDHGFPVIDVVTKDSDRGKYENIFNLFWDISNSGITRIMAGKGIIEETIMKVFCNNILPHKDPWLKYGIDDSERTEKALIRHVLGHLMMLLDKDEGEYYPEEVYISPPIDVNIRTGSIIIDKTNDHFFIVLNPACDLVVRSGDKMNTDRILLAEIDNQEILTKTKGILESKFKKEIREADKCSVKTPPECMAYTKLQENGNKAIADNLGKLYRNTNQLYLHYLPTTKLFCGGFINFRKINTVTTEGLIDKYSEPKIQISQAFIKDIISRFSAYYARQGQPDIFIQE